MIRFDIYTDQRTVEQRHLASDDDVCDLYKR